MRSVFLFILISFSPWLTAQNMVVPFREKDGKWSLVRKYSKERVAESYDKIDYIEEGVYQVWSKSKVGLIDTLGNILLPARFDTLYGIVEFADGLYPLKDSGTIKYFNNKGVFEYEWKYQNQPYSHVYYNQGLLDTYVGFIDKKGKMVIPKYEHTAIDQFEDNGLCQVGKKNETGEVLWGVIDKENTGIVPMQYEWLEIEADHIIAGNHVMKKHICFDLRGKKILKGKYDELKVFLRAGLYSYVKDDDQYIFSLRDIKSGREISDKYEDFYELSDGNILVNDGVHYLIVGKGGRISNDFTRFKSLVQGDHFGRLSFNDSLGRQGIITINGEILFFLPSDFFIINYEYVNGYVVMNKKSRKEGFVNLKGDFIIQPEYDALWYYPDLKVWKVRDKNYEYFTDEKKNRFIAE